MKYDKYSHRYVFTVVIVVFFLFCVLVRCTVAQTLWENSPYNYANNEYVYANTQYDYRNNPLNWENNEFNVTARHGVYTNAGERAGYEVLHPDGTRNFFDGDGNRIGYGR
jgi:uncharacterized membrane protein